VRHATPSDDVATLFHAVPRGVGGPSRIFGQLAARDVTALRPTRFVDRLRRQARSKKACRLLSSHGGVLVSTTSFSAFRNLGQAWPATRVRPLMW